jgi:uncharacterized protein
MPYGSRLSRGVVEQGRGQLVVLNVPGLGNSGPDHWQSRWAARYPWISRVELGTWDNPDRNAWAQRLDQSIRQAGGKAILVAHSLGCLTVAWWAALYASGYMQSVAGALLVAPADADREPSIPTIARFGPVPLLPLPFPSILVASRNDPYASFDRAAMMARYWGSHLVDAGEAGHINAESGLGDWPQGLALLDRLTDAVGEFEETGSRLASSARFHSRSSEAAAAGLNAW